MTCIPSREMVPNAPLREALVRSPLRLATICRRMGIDVRSNTTRIRRILGLDAYRSKSKKGDYRTIRQTRLSIVNAQRIAEALEVDFDELYAEYLPSQDPACLCKLCLAPMLEPDPEDLCLMCREEIDLFGGVDQQWRAA